MCKTSFWKAEMLKKCWGLVLAQLSKENSEMRGEGVMVGVTDTGTVRPFSKDWNLETRMKEAMQNSRCRVLVDLSQGDPHTSPIWHECHGAQLELAFHITFKFLDFREQPYKGGTDSADKGRGMERQRLQKKNKGEIFAFPNTKDKMFQQILQLGKRFS